MTPGEILEHYDFFEQASRSFQEEVLASSESVSLPMGFHPLQEGSGCPGVAFVGNGDIRVYKVSSEGREVTLYQVGPGETCLLTLNAAMGTSLYPASEVVEAPVEAMAVPVESFRSWINRVLKELEREGAVSCDS